VTMRDRAFIARRRRDLRSKKFLVNIAPTDKQLFQGGTYIPGLARFPGDKRAVVSSRSEIRRILEEDQAEARGIVDFTPPQFADREPSRKYQVADDIVDRHLERLEHEVGPMSDDERAEAREKIRQQLSGDDVPETSGDEIWNED